MKHPPHSAPSLPARLKEQLPAFSQAHYLPARFMDSTHDLWVLENPPPASEQMLLKVCRNTESPFWQIMHDLFGFDLTAEIPHFTKVYHKIGKASPLTIPPLIDAGLFSEQKSINQSVNSSKTIQNAYLLNHFLPGEPVKMPDSAMIDQLAVHLAAMHRLTSPRWGTFTRPGFETHQWYDRLATTLLGWSGNQTTLSHERIASALAQCKKQADQHFVAIMPDLRWDQFLHHDGRLSALVDLDAFVFAPRELDFVLLEYLLDERQLTRFNAVYRQFHDLPDIACVRPAYRLLLFFMEVLGEKDIHRWMAQKSIL